LRCPKNTYVRKECFYSSSQFVATTTRAILAAGTGSWASVSNRNAKTDFNQAEPTDVLQCLATVPIQTWRYKGQDERYISTVDGDGVALAAIQGLHELVKEQQAEIERMRAAMARAGIE
jgi:hypothetical protein